MKAIGCFLLLLLFFSCCVERQTDDTVIAGLIKKYPELTHESDGKFELVKTLILRDNQTAVRLYHLPNTYKEHNQIIVIINKKGQRRAIPLFSNAAAKYWHFEHDPENKRTQTASLFETSFIDAINELGLNDSTGIGYKVFFNIIQSVLNCETLNENDIPLLETTMVDGDSEDDEACKKRVALSKKSILKRMKYGNWKDVTQMNAFYEEQENRVFQLCLPEGKWGKIHCLHIRVYRFDERFEPMYL